jgi:uncharacterized protein (TIGR04376 family)
MSLWDELEQFLSSRLEEFLKANPQLEILVVLEKVRSEEDRAQKALVNLRREEKEVHSTILETAQNIKKWYERKQKAQTALRPDLVEAAQEQETQLLTQGNKLWNRKTEIVLGIQKNEKLLQELLPRRQALEEKLRQEQINEPPPRRPSVNRDVEAQFQQWEIEESLNELKKKMGR